MTRFCAVTAPALMLLYGILRFFDGLDDRRGGWLWDVGHVAFFVAMILFAILALLLRTPQRLSTAATAAVLFGAACFLWVIAGDLSDRFQSAAPLPDVLQVIGPLLFQIGLLTLLVLRRLPWWSPALVLGGFVALAVDLDLLPLASLLVAAGLTPLSVPHPRALVDAA
jgi:hypothetical protein